MYWTLLGARLKEVKSKNSVAVRAHPKLPAAVKRFWGSPPVDRTEKEEEYWSFAAAIFHDLDPPDSIMMLLVKDVVDHSWEVRTLRKHLSQLSVLAELKRNTLWPEDEKENERYFATAHGEAALFVESLGTFETFARLLDRAEGRRMVALKEIERYRKALAERLRERSDNAILAGEFSVAAPGPEIDGAKSERIDQTSAGKRDTDGGKPPSDPPDPVRS